MKFSTDERGSHHDHLLAILLPLLAFASLVSMLDADGATWQLRGVPTSHDTRFMDMENILGATRCSGKGYDVLRSNPCDIEPARIFRRHKLLRGCAHGKSIQVSSRSAGASGPARF
jgi:hypothetical protein